MIYTKESAAKELGELANKMATYIGYTDSQKWKSFEKDNAQAKQLGKLIYDFDNG